MLTISAIVRKSNISGQGLFTNKKIEKGTVIVKSGEKERYYSLKQFKNFSHRYRKILDKFSYWDKEKGMLVYPLDNSKYINHSCEPNITSKDNVDIATRDIKKGEELTYDYGPIQRKGQSFRCKCGCRHCRILVKPQS